MTHVPKSVTYGGIALVSLFVVVASYWYKSEFLKTNPAANLSATNVATLRGNKITEKASAYAVEVEYPSITISIDGSKEANAFFTNIYSKKVEDFKKQAEESYRTAPKELLKENLSSYYTVSFQEVASTSRYNSLLVSSETYYVGMAHPSHEQDTFIFDKKLKKLINTDALFSASSSYRSEISSLSREFFEARNAEVGYDGAKIDTTEGNDGFAPTVENFSKMLPTPSGLVIYFSEYQIGPYVAGPQQALISYSKLKESINSGGVLVEYK